MASTAQSGGEETTWKIRSASRAGAYMRDEIGKQAGVMALELGVGFGASFGLGLYEGILVLSTIPPQPRPPSLWWTLRYSLYTTLPMTSGLPVSTDALMKHTLKGAGPEDAALHVRLQNLRAVRRVFGLGALVCFASHLALAVTRGRERYKRSIEEGREPPLTRPAVLRICALPDAPPLGSGVFPILLRSKSSHDEGWISRQRRMNEHSAPFYWSTFPEWLRTKKEWSKLLGPLERMEGTTTGNPFLILEAQASLQGDESGMYDLLTALRAAKEAGVGDEIVRVLLAPREGISRSSWYGGGADLKVAVRGAAEIMVDTERLTASAVVGWLHATLEAASLERAASTEQRDLPEDDNGVEPSHEQPIKGWRWVTRDMWLDGKAIVTFFEALERLGRYMRSFFDIKRMLQARSRGQRVIFVLCEGYDATGAGIMRCLTEAGWWVQPIVVGFADLEELLQIKDPILVHCRSDSKSLNIAAGLVQAGRPKHLTCALVEQSRAWCGEMEVMSHQVLSVQDIYDLAFTHIRQSLYSGHTAQRLQSDIGRWLDLSLSPPAHPAVEAAPSVQ